LEKLKVEISEEDRELEVHTGKSAAKITILRKGVEECIVQTLYTLDEDIVRSRQELKTTDDAHKLNIGNMLWQRTMNKYKAYFSDDLAERNKKWWKKLYSQHKPVAQKKTNTFVDRGNGVRVMHFN
jgi:hypothetical protein